MSVSTARTIAPASITSVVRLRSRTFSRTVDQSFPDVGGARFTGYVRGRRHRFGVMLRCRRHREAGRCRGSRCGVGAAAGGGSGTAGAGGRGQGQGQPGGSNRDPRTRIPGPGRHSREAAESCGHRSSVALRHALMAASAAGIEMSIRVSMRSMRCSSADSVSLAGQQQPGAHHFEEQSGCRGTPHLAEPGVHHLRIPRQGCRTDSGGLVAHPLRTSSGASTTPRLAASGTACSTIRSRKRSRRSHRTGAGHARRR